MQSGEKPADHATKMTKKENLKWISTCKPDEVGWDADIKCLSGEKKDGIVNFFLGLLGLSIMSQTGRRPLTSLRLDLLSYKAAEFMLIWLVSLWIKYAYH